MLFGMPAGYEANQIGSCAPAAAGTGALRGSSVIFLSLGGARGPFPQSTANFDGKESKRRFRKGPSTALRMAPSTAQSHFAGRGSAKAFSRRDGARVLRTTTKDFLLPSIGRGSGAPKGAISLGPRNTGKRCRCSGAAARTFGARSPSGAPLAALARTFTSWLSSRPGFLGLGSRGRYPPSPVPVQGKHLPPRP